MQPRTLLSTPEHGREHGHGDQGRPRTSPPRGRILCRTAPLEETALERSAAPGWRGDRSRGPVRDVPRVLGDTGRRAAKGPLLVCIERPARQRAPGGCPGPAAGVPASGARRAAACDGSLDRSVGQSARARRRRAVPRRGPETGSWSDGSLERATSNGDAPRELTEAHDIARRARGLELDPEGRAALLDVHSTSGGGAAFTSLDDTLANRALAFAIPVPHVWGWRRSWAGTLVSHVNERGVPATRLRVRTAPRPAVRRTRRGRGVDRDGSGGGPRARRTRRGGSLAHLPRGAVRDVPQGGGGPASPSGRERRRLSRCCRASRTSSS